MLHYCNRWSEGIHSHIKPRIVSPHHYHKLKSRKKKQTNAKTLPLRCKSFIRLWMINVSIFFFVQIMAPRWSFWLDVVSILIPAIIIHYYFAVTMMVVLCDGKLMIIYRWSTSRHIPRSSNKCSSNHYFVEYSITILI